jgi:hypothetical protein
VISLQKADSFLVNVRELIRFPMVCDKRIFSRIAQVTDERIAHMKFATLKDKNPDLYEILRRDLPRRRQMTMKMMKLVITTAVAILFLVPFQGAMAQQQQQNNTAQNATAIWKEMQRQSAEFVSHPVVALIIGTVVTVFMIPYFTNKWQKHQKGLEIKVDLIRRMSKNIMEIMTLIESLSEPYDDEKLELEKEIRRFKIDNKTIGTELEGYYPAEEKKEAKKKDPAKEKDPPPDKNMRVAWDDLRRSVLLYYELCKEYVEGKSSEVANEKNKKTIDDIIQGKDCKEKGEEQEELRKRHCEIIQKKHRMIWFMLDAPLPEFSLWPRFIVCSRPYRRGKFRHYRRRAQDLDVLVQCCINELRNVHDNHKYETKSHI